MANLQVFMLILIEIGFYASVPFCAAHGSDSLLSNKHSEKTAEETDGAWAWIDGSDHGNQKNKLHGSHDYPGSRFGASIWQDSDGIVWIYGGQKYGRNAPLDELWSLDVKNQGWNFHHFENKTTSKQQPPPCFGCASCHYGNRVVVFGLSSTFIFHMENKYWTALRNLSASPSPRSHSAYWCDSAKGILWIFGGQTLKEKFGDFWRFSFQEMQWIEVKPPSNTSVVPDKCSKASAWILSSADLYMFGGSTQSGLTSNFWQFSPKSTEWTKLSGTTGLNNCAGKYGKMGITSKNNYPGCREGAATWVNEQGDLLMFGGSGFDNFSRGPFAEPGLLSDFWMFEMSSHQWVWIGGLSRGEGVPVFGEKGKSDPHNIPGPRESPVSFSFANQLWLFGGEGHDVKQRDGILNDLWMYEHVTENVPGDTLNISFGFRVLIALFVLTLVLVLSVCLCYSKECRVFRWRRGLRTVVKYKPVKVDMRQVEQPEVHPPLDEPPTM